MTQPSDEGSGRASGILASARRAIAHAGSLARLERELAQAELRRKGAALGAGAAVGLGAAAFALFAVGFGLATIAAALALVVDWWLALLIVFLGLVVVVAILGLVARKLLRAGTPLKPERALAEAELTKSRLRSLGGD